MDKIQFEDFLMEVESAHLDFIMQIHEYLTKNGCTTKIMSAKSGYVVSYSLPKTKKVLANYLFRKKGLIIRIYGDNISKYMDLLDTLPEEMSKTIEISSVCKRLLDPEKCNSRCPMGYAFVMNGTEYKKCRYSSFMFLIESESKPYIKAFLENEFKERLA